MVSSARIRLVSNLHDQLVMTPTNLIYKICARSDWEAAQSSGQYDGAPIDIQDGFIHFSNARQVKETAAKHFAGIEDLVLVAFDAEQFGDALKWEVSRGGEQFPHLYGPLPADSALQVFDLPLGSNGNHVFPEGI